MHRWLTCMQFWLWYESCVVHGVLEVLSGEGQNIRGDLLGVLSPITQKQLLGPPKIGLYFLFIVRTKMGLYFLFIVRTIFFEKTRDLVWTIKRMTNYSNTYYFFCLRRERLTQNSNLKFVVFMPPPKILLDDFFFPAPKLLFYSVTNEQGGLCDIMLYEIKKNWDRGFI
jgi:hypothetical protein